MKTKSGNNISAATLCYQLPTWPLSAVYTRPGSSRRYLCGCNTARWGTMAPSRHFTSSKAKTSAHGAYEHLLAFTLARLAGRWAPL